MQGGPPDGGFGHGPMDGLSLLITLAFSLLLLIPFWRIYARAGLPPWFSLLVLVPYVGLPAAAAVLAFRSWPNGESRRFAGPRRSAQED